MEHIIGIDLGTTNSVVAVWQLNDTEVIVNQEGKRTTPSIVSFTKNKEGSLERKIGDPAKRQSQVNPKNTIYSAKRFIGSTWNEIEKETKTVPYKVSRGKNNTPIIDIEGTEYTPQQISAMVLGKLKEAAENNLGVSVGKAVITVPAYFNDAQRNATKEAAEIAGLECLRIINEPTAAAIAYGIDKKNADMNIAVFDLGGGTFDISILEISGGVFEVKSTNGDTHLGGDDFDQIIMKWIVDNIKMKYNTDITNDVKAMQRIRDAAETAKIELSSQMNTTITIPYITSEINFEEELNRATFESLSSHLIERCMKPVKQAMADAKLSPSDIHEVILVGGSTRIPKVQEVVKNYFNKEPNKTVNPDEVVAIGAAIQGGILRGDIKDMLLLDVTPLTLGIEVQGGIVEPVVDANTTIPTTKKKIFTTASDNQTSVEIHITQGERKLANDNKTLGKFHLDGILPAKRQVPQIEVTFDIDANGILSVKAMDLGTKKEQKIRIESSTKLSKDDIEKMKQEAERFKEEDERKAKNIELKNEAIQKIYYIKNTLINENSEIITEDEKQQLNDIIQLVETDINNENYEDIEKNTNNLMELAATISQRVYQQKNQQEQDNTNFNQANVDDSQEVEFEEVN